MKNLLKISQISLTYILIFSLQAQTSKIEKVKLFQNRAKITRTISLNLKQGLNKITLNELPSLMLDWSIRGRLPKNFVGKILSIEVEKKALLEKRNSNIKNIEKEILLLKEQDQQQIDELQIVHDQHNFMTSVLRFSKTSATKDLISGNPKIKIWDQTLNYSSKKKETFAKKIRAIEKLRQKIGKKLQVLEHKLYQIAGRKFYNNFQKMNLGINKNISQMTLQDYSKTSILRTRNQFLTSNSIASQVEKQINIEIFSKRNKSIQFEFEYQISNSNWQMQYDLRANLSQKQVTLNVYGKIHQKTGENWNNVNLTLSTASPNNSLSQPSIKAWPINAWKKRVYKTQKRYSLNESKISDKSSGVLTERFLGARKMKRTKNYQKIRLSKVKSKGLSFDISLPTKQKIESSIKSQKKFIKEFNLSNKKSVEFYYEIYPQVNQKSFIKTVLTNNTSLPWLRGNAQLFLENEFMGKVTLPYTPIGKKQTFILGNDSRITASKKLVKKYEDTAGMFGGNRKIQYDYEIKVENLTDKLKKISIVDVLPYATSKNITIQIDKLSLAYYLDPKLAIKDLANKLMDSNFLQGKRNWRFQLKQGEKKIIKYTVIVTADKDFKIYGLK